MIERHIVGKTKAVDHRDAFPELLVGKHPAASTRIRSKGGSLGLPRHTMADPAKALTARAYQRGQDRLDTAAQHHIRVSNNAGGHPGFSKGATAAHSRDAIANSTSPTGRISSGPRSRYIE